MTASKPGSKIVETKVPISSELINDCKIQSSMNENEMNFQNLEYLDVEFLNSNFELKEAVLSIDESSVEGFRSMKIRLFFIKKIIIISSFNKIFSLIQFH